MRDFFQDTKLTGKHFRVALLLSFMLALLVALILSQLYRMRYSSVMETYNKEMETAVNITEVYVNEKVKDVDSTIRILANTDAVKAYVESSQEDNQKQVENLFAKYVRNHLAITQLRILDMQGMEKVRVDKSEEGFKVVPLEQMQDKSQRYYYQEAIAKEQDMMYISDFDLNIEHEKVVIPYEPTIRFAIKLYDEQNQAFGLLIINVDGYALFDTIKEYEVSNLEHKEIGILDHNNYWSFSNIVNDENNLEAMGPVYLNLTERSELGMLKDLVKQHEAKENEFNAGQYTYETKHIIYKKMRISDNIRYSFSQDNSDWFVVGQYDAKALVAQEHFFLKNIVLITIISSFLVGLVTYMLMIFYQIKANNDLLLLASSYISDNSHDGIIILDRKRKILYYNEVFEAIFSVEEHQFINKHIRRLFKDKIDMRKDVDAHNILWKGNIWNKTQYGNIVCKHLTIKGVKNAQNHIAYYIGIYVNPEEAQINQQPFLRDGMNAFLMSRQEVQTIGQEVQYRYDKAQNYLILTIQLKGSIRKMFEANQMLHGKFLETMLEGLRDNPEIYMFATPRTDMVIMGCHNTQKEYDEFEIKEIIDRIKGMFVEARSKMHLEQLDINFNIGVALQGKHGEDAEAVLKNSMVALEALIKFKKNQYLFYDKKYHDSIKQDLKIRDALEQAFDNNEFNVLYQPQFSVKDNQIIGAEALVRWNSNTLGNVSPDRFIPILEETEDIFRLGLHVLELIQEDFQKFKPNREKFRISFNLSAKEFLNKKLLDAVVERLKELLESGLSVCVEITETALIENFEFANSTIKALRDLGIEVAIDDFGTGYSSLSYLKTLSTTELKIDRMFIREYPDQDDGKIIKGIIGMGKAIQMHLVAEGIETNEQLELIKEIECDCYQGYLASKPISIEEMKKRYDF